MNLNILVPEDLIATASSNRIILGVITKITDRAIHYKCLSGYDYYIYNSRRTPMKNKIIKIDSRYLDNEQALMYNQIMKNIKL